MKAQAREEGRRRTRRERAPRNGSSLSSGRPVLRDRVVELRRVKASELLPDPRNWRRHPQAQAAALRALLAEVGWANACLARQTEQGLVLIDGHLRREVAADAVVPVLVLDVTESEAQTLLATLDPLAGMAVADSEALRVLLAEAVIPDVALL